MNAATVAKGPPHGEGRAATARPSTAKPQATTPNDLRNIAGQESAAPRRSMADRLIEYADEQFSVYRSHSGLIYGARLDEPVRSYAHGAAGSPLLNEIKSAFHVEQGKWPDSKASASCSEYLTVQALRTPPREVALRSSWDGRRLLIDTGDADWRVLEVTADGWRYADPLGVTFRRSDVTAALPDLRDVTSDLDALWRLVNVAEADRPLVLALLIGAWLTGVSQPVVYVTGPQDAGKTEAARLLLRIVDPVTLTERGGSLPAREEEWKSRVSLYRCVLVDNASNITAAQSDTLCKVATGGESITRALYTNDTAHVTNLQVPVWLTSIGVGALRNDLQSRMVRVELEGLDPSRRLALSDLRRAQAESLPGITRGLLDLTASVLTEWDSVDRSGLAHRLTDYLLVLRCVDRVLGTDGAARLVEVADELSADVLDADPVAQAVLRGLEQPSLTHPVEGTRSATDLLTSLGWFARAEPRVDGPGWPRTPRILGEHLRRVQPALAAEGIAVEFRKSNGARVITVRRVAGTQGGTQRNAACAPAEPAPDLRGRETGSQGSQNRGGSFSPSQGEVAGEAL